MNIKITSKDGATLKTANKYVEEDIAIVLDESFAQPSGTLEVTENGTHDVTNYESVDVNVSSSGNGVNLLQKQIDDYNAFGLFSNWVNNKNLDEYINSLDFSNTDHTGYMFAGCGNLKSIPFFNTSSVTNMQNMFRDCGYLTTIPQLDTSNVVYMSQMFYYCGRLTSVPQLNTSNVVYMDHMFYSCTSLTTIPQLDTSKSTSISYMFYNCKALTTIPQLNTSSVTNMRCTFSNCSALTSVPQLDTSNVTTIDHMFSSCSVLTNVPQLDTSKATDMSYMFYKCEKLTTIDITYYNISNTSYIANFANGCTALKSLIIREFGANYVLSSNSFTGSGIVNGTGYIYVPRAMVDILSQSTNWSTYASQIRALEDYTVDGTTTGALDETKI